MSSSCNCIRGAAKGLRPAAALRLPIRTSARRSFASSPSSRAQASRTNRSTTCLFGAQKEARPIQSVVNSWRGQTRPFSNSTPRQALKTVEQIKARNKGGVRILIPRLFTIYIDMLIHFATAIQFHSRDPLRRSRRWTMGLFHIRERAHGTETDSRPDKGHGKAEGWRSIQPTRSQQQAVLERGYGREVCAGTSSANTNDSRDANGIIGVLWLHALPRHLPRRTRQDGAHVRQGG